MKSVKKPCSDTEFQFTLTGVAPRKRNYPNPPRLCKTCGAEFEVPKVQGRPPVYCSAECRPSPIKKKRDDPDYLKRKKERAATKQAKHRAPAAKGPTKELLPMMDRVVTLLAQGFSPERAMAKVGRSKASYYDWCRRWPRAFAVRADKAIAQAHAEFVPEQVPFDAGFRQRYFHHDTPPHLQRLIDVINEQVAIAEKERARDRRVLILLPPEHAKSTLLEEYVSYRIAQDVSFRCSIVCATQGQAKKRLGAIGRILTDTSVYSELIEDFGPFKSEVRGDSKPWTAFHFTHLFAPPDQRDYTCQAMGWNGSPYGDRMDLIVCDDIADLKNQTPATIEDQWEKLWGEFRSRIRRGGLFVVIGTHMRENDVYTVMEERGFFTDKVVMPAIVREPGTLSEDDEGQALWEDNVSMRELLKIRETDPRMFELMYQQNPLPSIGAVFTQEMIEACYNPERYIGHIPENCRIVAGVDPSVSNYTAGVVFAISPKGTRYLVDVWNEKGLTGEGGDNHAGVVEFIVELCRTYRVNTLCVEDGTWMTYINNSQTLRSKLYDLNVNHYGVKVGPGGGRNESETDAIAQLSGLFTHRMIDLPGSPASKQRLNPMVHQFLTWTGEKQHWRKAFDIIKAFRQAEYAARHFSEPGKAHLAMNDGGDVPSFLEQVRVA